MHRNEWKWKHNNPKPVQFSSVQSLSRVQPMNRSMPGLPVHHQLPEFTQIHVHRVIDAIQPSHPRSSTSPPAPNPSQHQSLCQWVNSSHEMSKEIPGLISFRMDWLDLLAVQGTLKSLLQHHSSKASILWHSAFFTDHWKNYALTRRTFVGKVMSLLFNMLGYGNLC